MKLLLSDNRLGQLDSIIKRAELPYKKENALIQIMIFRQSLLFLKAPKKYIKGLLKSTRIVESDLTYLCGYNSQIVNVVNNELEKVLDRHGTGIEGIASATAEKDVLFTKMLVKEINALFKKKKGCHRYKKVHFSKMQEQIKSSSQSFEFPASLEDAIKKLHLDRECMIYYFLLSVNLPDSISDEHALNPSFIKEIINMKSKAMDQFIQEARNGMKDREVWEFIDSLDNSAILAFKMRQYLEHGESIGEYSKEDLHKEVKEWFKENG